MQTAETNSRLLGRLEQVRSAPSPSSQLARTRLGSWPIRLLLASGPLFACAWLLSGVTHPAAFSVGLAISLGTLATLLRTMQTAIAPVRRVLAPIALASGTNAILLICFVASQSAALELHEVFAYTYVTSALAIPLAVSYGLRRERLFLGDALASFVSRLSASHPTDVERVMAESLRDPTLTIVYWSADAQSYLDRKGSAVDIAQASRSRSVALLADNGRPVAAVLLDRELRDQRRFIEAAGHAAMMSLQKARLAAELTSSTRELRLSRRRLVDAAVSERQRLQRDLHDSAQQQLVSMRVKLGLAQSAVRQDRARTERLLSGLQCELDAALQEMRSLANGVYPPVLTQYGLGGSLKAACQRASIPVHLQMHALQRYSRDIEGAVHFTCVEALQNAEKHAGRSASATVHIWQDDRRLRFTVVDSGVGFERTHEPATGTGLVSMRDRIEAVGGSLSVSSTPGGGTTVAGVVPLDVRGAR